MSRLTAIARPLFFIFAVLWITVIFATRFFIIPFGAVSTFYDNDDDLVLGKLSAGLSIAEEYEQFGGFLHRADGIPYLSQSGLQGAIFHFGYVGIRDQVTVEGYLTGVRVVLALLLAIALVAASAKALEAHHLLALAVVVVALASFRWVVQLSTSTSWFVLAKYLPFVFAWLLYPAVVQKRLPLVAFGAIIGGLVAFKGLTGYEYITNTIAAASVAVLYYEIRQRATVRRIANRVLYVLAWGGFGAVAALLIHYLQLTAFVDSPVSAFEVIFGRAFARTLEPTIHWSCWPDLNSAIPEYMSMPIFSTAQFLNIGVMHVAYFLLLPAVIWMRRRKGQRLINPRLIGLALPLGVLLMAFAIVQPQGNLGRYAALIGGHLMVIGLAALAETRWKFESQALPALYIATGWAMVCSWTWALLGRNHFQCHSYIAQIIFFIPFGVMFAWLVGALIASLVTTSAVEQAPAP